MQKVRCSLCEELCKSCKIRDFCVDSGDCDVCRANTVSSKVCHCMDKCEDTEENRQWCALYNENNEG